MSSQSNHCCSASIYLSVSSSKLSHRYHNGTNLWTMKNFWPDSYNWLREMDTCHVDEFSFFLSRAEGSIHVYRRLRGCYASNCVQQVNWFDCGSVVVWQESYRGKTALVHVAGASDIETRSCSITSFCTWNSTVECFSMMMPDHVLCVLGVSAVPRRPDIILACLFAGFKPNRTSVYTGEMPHPGYFILLLTALQHEWQIILQCAVYLLIAFMQRYC